MSKQTSTLPVVILREEEDGLPKEGIVWQDFHEDWKGQVLPFSLSWALIWRKRDLLFATRWPRNIEGIQAQKGVFQEGLWEGNCAEFFLAHPHAQEYWEFNLSPQGAWWWCPFQAPRERKQEQLEPLPGVRASWYETSESQVSVLSIPRLHLERWLQAMPPAKQKESIWRGNVSACLGQPQQFASVAQLSAQEVDFHQPDDFLALQMGVS